ncbi:MAG: peptidase T, partial [Bacteroidetes bacterium]
PGTAKDQMINSLMIGMELHTLLPVNQRPEHTEEYEGFFMLMSFNGSVEETSMMYIIRDHDMAKFKIKNELMKKAVDYMNTKYGKDTIEMDLKDQYYNMKEKVEPVKHIVDRVEKAMIEVGVTPLIKAIRGGTDGSRLSYMGLPTPNIFTGGHNFHGKYEYIPIQSMEKAVKVILKLIEIYAEG